MDRHCVVLAGGLGTRLREITGGLIPKVMVPVNGRPFIDYKLSSLANMGFKRITVLAGQHGDQVEQHLLSIHSSKLEISTVLDGPTLLGTAGSIAKSLDRFPETFWVTYGDSYVVADIAAIEQFFACSEFRVMTVLHNRDFLETSNTTVRDGRVISHYKPASPGVHEWLDYGLLRFTHRDFANISLSQPTDLSHVINDLIKRELLGAWEVSDRFWEIGSPGALAETSHEFSKRDWTKPW